MNDVELRNWVYTALLDAGLLFEYTYQNFVVANGFVCCKTNDKESIVNALNHFRVAMFCNLDVVNFTPFHKGIVFNIENISA